MLLTEYEFRVGRMDARRRAMTDAGAVRNVLATLALAGVLASCGAATGSAGAVPATATVALATATPRATPTATPSPAAATEAAATASPVGKATPCPPVAADPAKTGVRGTVTWNGAPAAGVRIEAVEPCAPGPCPAVGSGVSGADGGYTISRLPTGRPIALDAPDQPGWVRLFAGTGLTLCGEGIVDVAPIEAVRAIAGANLARGSIVPPGTLSLAWQPLAGADRYCVSWFVAGVGTADRGCDRYPGYATVDPHYDIGPLASGSIYLVSVLALSGDALVGALPRRYLSLAVSPIGNVGPCATAATLSPDGVADALFRFLLPDGTIPEVATCFADDVPGRQALARAYLDTGGARTLQFQALPALADGSVPVETVLRWNDVDAVGAWTSGETRWLLMRTQPDGRWAIASVVGAPPR